MIAFIITIWLYYVAGYSLFMYIYREKDAIMGYNEEIIEKYKTVPIKRLIDSTGNN